MFFPEVAAVLLALLQHPAMILAAPQSQTIKPVVPEAAVAAAAAVLPATGAVLEARTLSPHIKCYSGGALLSSLGSSSAVDDLINSACSTFATYSGQKFVPDSTVCSLSMGLPLNPPSPPSPKLLRDFSWLFKLL